MDLRKLLIIILIGCTLLAVLLVFFNKSHDVPKDQTGSVISQIELVVDDSYQKPVKYLIDIESTATVFDVLKRSPVSLETKEYTFGLLVKALNGVTNGQDNKYWIYYLNDQLGQTSADSQKVKASDRILWRFEKNKF